MKKFLILLFISVCFLGTTQVKSQAVEEGNVLIDAYYGFPNLATAALKTLYANGSQVLDLKIGGLGPLGGRVEYMLADKIGLGLEVNYANSYVEWGEDSLNLRYTYKVSAPRMRILPRFNFHFSSSESLDAYFAIGAGYYNIKYKFESNDPNYSPASEEGLIPFTARVAVGMRYFFTENIGLGAEFGLGGPLVTFGAAIKF